MKKIIEKKILEVESRHAFTPSWIAIFFNPFFIIRRHLYKAVNEFSQSCQKDARILDVGCGIKPYRPLFKTDSYIGIDVKGGGHDDTHKTVDFFFDGTHIPFEKNEFDAVLATEVFEHAQDLDGLISEIYRALKPNGSIFITMPFVWPEHETPYDFRRFTSFEHNRILGQYGFHDIIIKPTTGVFGTCGQVLSDFLLHQFASGISKASSKGMGYKIKFITTRLFILLICFPVQLLFLSLDALFQKKGLTCDYTVTAKK